MLYIKRFSDVKLPDAEAHEQGPQLHPGFHLIPKTKTTSAKFNSLERVYNNLNKCSSNALIKKTHSINYAYDHCSI